MTNVNNVIAAISSRIAVAPPLLHRPAGNTNMPKSKLTGLAPMTPVTTSFGEVPAVALRKRDRVRTREGNFLEIQSVDYFRLDEDFLAHHPNAQPVLFRAGSLGSNIPKSDIMLAPHQMITSGQSELPLGVERAADAVNDRRILRYAQPHITYTVIRCGQPASVNCEGLWLDIGD